jgi:hydrogenase maturation protein HypF
MIKSKYNHLKTFKINISGIVQGVGFRPFIYRLAQKYNLNGIVTNTTEGVTIKINASGKDTVDKFTSDIKLQKPSAAVIENIKVEEIPSRKFKGFEIGKSKETEEKFQLISPDIATCSFCIEDIKDKSDIRRYYYPFTNCTNCGPRFTIIQNMPYDRPNTTMHKFLMCEDCFREYHNPQDRRFHAQPNACQKCGPKLLLIDRSGKKINSRNPIIKAAELLCQGKIIAIKSLGGFQIACSALSDDTVLELRKRKKRPVKPFAIMIKDIISLKKYYKLNEKEMKSLPSTRAPIVLLKKKIKNYPISWYVSLYNRYEGVMLPYTPIHHLLFNHIDIPLIMTSGNISEEPIAAENVEALGKLKNICDYFLIHNRDIHSRYDDSVIKIFDGREMIIRRARGYSPYPVKLNRNIEKSIIFAAGAHEKNTFCFLVKNYAIVSQHMGDLDDVESIKFYSSTFDHYRKLFNIEKIDTVVYDKHPSYASTKFAAELKNVNTRIAVQHHKAHIASVIAENGINEDLIGFAWDGTGYGDDGKIWGSEIFTVDSNLNFIRAGHLKEKFLPGSEITIKKPYRMAMTYLYYLWIKHKKTKGKFPEFVYNNLPFYKKIISTFEIEAIEKQIESGFNSPVTTSMGRFFDAVSSLLDCTHTSSFEGEAAIHLEMITDYKYKDGYKIKIDNLDNQYIINDHYIFTQIFKDILDKVPKNIISSKFHNTLVEIVLKVSQMIRKTSGTSKVVLSGGVFQNNYLLDRCFNVLKNNDFEVYSNFIVPVNDGGISLGQSYIAALRILSSKKGGAVYVSGHTSKDN